MDMNITLDKDFTTLSNEKMVLDEIARFCDRYTPQDVLDAFFKACPEYACYAEKVIACYGDAYCSDVGKDRKVKFDLYVIAEGPVHMIKARIACDQDLNVRATAGETADGESVRICWAEVYTWTKRV